MTTLTITRIAHASVLIDFDGYRVLTDPWFSEQEGYYHGEPYGIALQDLPRLAGVVVSHEHYDHYDMQAFQAYPDKQVVMNPLDAAELCRIIHPRYAVPTHYTFTGGPIKDAQTLKYAGTPEELLRAFQQAMIQCAPETATRILAPGEPLRVPEADRRARNAGGTVSEDEVTGVVIAPDIDRSEPRPLIAVLDAKPGQADELRELIIKLTRLVRHEPGCVSFIPYEADRIAGRFYLYEIFTDANAFEEHLELDHVKEFRAALPSVSSSGPADLVQLVEISIP